MTACQEQQKQAELSEKHSLKADIFLLENTDTPAISATVFNFFFFYLLTGRNKQAQVK